MQKLLQNYQMLNCNPIGDFQVAMCCIGSVSLNMQNSLFR